MGVKMAEQQGKKTCLLEPGNNHTWPAADRTGAAGHGERVRGTADQRERGIQVWELDIRGAGAVEGLVTGMGWVV
jgi:hypothetical protein